MSKRREKDNYETPAWCVDALLRNYIGGITTARLTATFSTPLAPLEDDTGRITTLDDVRGSR